MSRPITARLLPSAYTLFDRLLALRDRLTRLLAPSFADAGNFAFTASGNTCQLSD